MALASNISKEKPVVKPVKKEASLWEKAFFVASPESDWTREEINEVLHWLKQAVSVLLGITCGLFSIQGFAGFGVLLVGILLTGVYVQKLNARDEVIDLMESYQEGTMPAVMSFVLFWVVMYTLVHF